MPLVTTRQTMHGKVDGDAVHLVHTRFARVPGDGGQIENDLLPANTLSVRIGEQKHDFEGSGIVTTDTPVGALATVQLETVPDLGTTSLSFFVPAVNAAVDGAEVEIRTIAVRTLARTTIAGPPANEQASVYTSLHLHGTQTVTR